MSSSIPDSGTSTFIGLDATAWTAIGTLVALFIAVGGLVVPWLRAKLTSPRLLLDVRNAMNLSSSLDNGVSFWVRVPVSNLRAGSVAQNVEAFLVSISSEDPTHADALRSFVPMRLRWSHTAGPVCDRIPGSTYKLIDIGVLYPVGIPKKLVNELTLPFWQFTGEMDASYAPRIPPLGSLSARLIISADGIRAHRQEFELNFTKGIDGDPTVEIRSS